MPINTQPETVGIVTMSTGGVNIVDILLSHGGNMQTMSVTATGTWTGPATLAYEVSNDNVNWFGAKDTAGNTLALTADGGMTLLSSEFANAYLYGRLRISGGAGDSVVVVVAGGRG